jgi:hypothetical protein
MDERATVDIGAFLRRWTAREGRAERIYYGLFIIELCDFLNVGWPRATEHKKHLNKYPFKRQARCAGEHTKSIELYKTGSFNFELEQLHLAGGNGVLALQPRYGLFLIFIRGCDDKRRFIY